MATTGKSNGHLGISHPFGARHGTPVAGQGNERTQQSLADRMYGAKKDPLTQPLPVSPDAPLQERMYAENVSDVVARHAAKTHDLKPFRLNPEAEVPYYQMGVRPLDFPGMRGLYGNKIPLKSQQHFDHMQFVGSDGSNFGLSKGEGLLVEDMKTLFTYEVEAPRYRKEYVDRARQALDAEWEKEKGEAYQAEFTPLRYDIFFKNCQHYFAAIMQKAQEYETIDKPLVLQ